MSTDVATVSTALTVKQRAIAALGFSEEKEVELRALAKRTETITTMTNDDGYMQVHNGRIALKKERCEIQTSAKEARDEATKFSKGVIEEERRLVAIVSAEEGRLQKIQDAYDAKIEAEKQAKIDAELKRVTEIQRRIEMIRAWPVNATGKPSSLVKQQLQTATDFTIGDEFAEFAETARSVLETSRAALDGILAERAAHEAEQERIKVERAELAKLRAEQEERDRVERARIAEEERKARAERDAEAAAQAEELRKQREELARQEREQKAARDAEEKRLADQRAEIERQQEALRKAQEPKPRVKLSARPSDAEIVSVLALHYRVHESKIVEWLLAMDLSNPALSAA